MRSLVVVITTTLVIGCGSDCAEPCAILYGTVGEQCAIQRPGYGSTDLVDLCMDQCGDAMAVRGDVGDYDPYAYVGDGESVSLENRDQALLWKECIVETSCEDLELGTCAPIW